MSEVSVTSLAQDLMRIDTSNFGDNPGPGPGERVAAEYVATFLSDLGLDPVIRESEPTRASLTALWEGSDRTRPPSFFMVTLTWFPHSRTTGRWIPSRPKSWTA